MSNRKAILAAKSSASPPAGLEVLAAAAWSALFDACDSQTGTTGRKKKATNDGSTLRRMVICISSMRNSTKEICGSVVSENLISPVRLPLPSSNAPSCPFWRPTMLHILQDVRFGLRMLFRSRGLTFVAILALALGIGANTAIFSVVNAVLMRPLPFPAPNQLVWFWESQPHLSQAPFSGADFLDFESQNSSFSQLAAVHRLSFNLTGAGPAERIPAMVASTPIFTLLGAKPILGRAFRPIEGLSGPPPVAVLPYVFGQSPFGGDRAVIGKTINLDNQPVQIVGVLPASFRYGNDIQLWVNPVNTVPEIFSA